MDKQDLQKLTQFRRRIAISPWTQSQIVTQYCELILLVVYCSAWTLLTDYIFEIIILRLFLLFSCDQSEVLNCLS